MQRQLRTSSVIDQSTDSLTYWLTVFWLQEGYNNEKLNTHSHLKLHSRAYIISHSRWFYMLLLVVELLLLALAVIEPPAVPIDGFTAPPLV